MLFGGAAAAAPPASSPAPAPQPTGPLSNEMRAEQLFRAGEKKFDSGKYGEACADFSESLRLAPKLGTLLNLALCHETVGKPATAWREFHHAAAWAAQNNQKERHDFALQHSVALETKLPRVLLQLPLDGAIASVEVDGEPLPDSNWYLPVYLDPGEHSVTISAPGKQRGTATFRVVNSPTEQLVSIPSLADAPDPVKAPPPDAVPLDPDRGRRLAGVVTLSAGGALVITGLALQLVAMGKTEAGMTVEVRDDVSTLGTAGAVCTVIGLASAVAGGWLVLSSRAPGPSRPARVGVGLRSRPGGAELGLGASF